MTAPTLSLPVFARQGLQPRHPRPVRVSACFLCRALGARGSFWRCVCGQRQEVCSATIHRAGDLGAAHAARCSVARVFLAQIAGLAS